MDAREAISATENALRDLISHVLSAKLGAKWFEQSGLTAERLAKIAARREEEAKRREGAIVDDRPIFYADITDLPAVIHKAWEDFAPILGDQKTFDVYMDRLGAFRIAEMHGRDLLPFEEQLAVGMSGELRTKVTLYLSGRTEADRHFPRIERVTDSFGNARPPKTTDTGIVLAPGDEVEFRCVGWDPDGGQITWRILTSRMKEILADGDVLTWRVTAEDIGEQHIVVYAAGDRPYHRHGSWDDAVNFAYLVVPRRTEPI